jgi:hypothetical protein
MGHTPFGYKIENGSAVVDEAAAGQIRQIFQFYLEGDSLATAAKKAGVISFHGGISRMLKNKHYLGDEYYPAIIDRETFDRAEQERMRRATALGRIKEPAVQEGILIPTVFHIKPMEQTFDDPFLQTEYAYSLIESEE